MNRREFLISSGIVVGAAAAGLSAQEKKRPLGVQLYTVRKQNKDLAGVLASIRQIGYDEVETYWDIYNRPASELKKMINDHGLTAPSGHFNYEGLEAKLDYAKELGVSYVICPMLPNKWQGAGLDNFKRAADQFNRWGEKVKGMGMRFGFHNHNYEFKKYGDTTGFDILMSQTDPELMCLEMDCYWITQAGLDPVQMLKKHASRIRLLHLKDRQSGFPTSQKLGRNAEHFTPPGTGTIDWKTILATAQTNGVQHMFVEQDSSHIPPVETLRIAYKNLQPLL